MIEIARQRDAKMSCDGVIRMWVLQRRRTRLTWTTLKVTGLDHPPLWAGIMMFDFGVSSVKLSQGGGQENVRCCWPWFVRQGCQLYLTSTQSSLGRHLTGYSSGPEKWLSILKEFLRSDARFIVLPSIPIIHFPHGFLTMFLSPCCPVLSGT